MTRALILLAAVIAVGNILGVARARARPRDIMFPEQRAAADDPSPRKCLWTTGRAGKSTCVLLDFVDDAQEHAGAVYFFFSLTSVHAEEIAWQTLRRINNEFRIKARFQEQKLRMVLPNGSWIRLFGFDRPLAIDRYYGIRLRKAAIDEAAFSNIDLEEFIEDTLGPRLVDERRTGGGQVYMMSIPPRTPGGFFDKVIEGFPHRVNMSAVKSPSRPRWSVHSWTALDNPAMRDLIRTEMDEQIAADPGVIHRPSYRRNYLGERVQDRGELVYEFEAKKNTYHNAEGQSRWKLGPEDRYVLGLDFGWHDATAFALCVYRPDDPHLVELESYKEPYMRMDQIAARIASYYDLAGGAERVSTVGDYAHRSYFEEMRRRYNLPIKIAEKASKYDWIEVYNTDLHAGLIQYVEPDTSPHVAEMRRLVWKVNAATGKTQEQPGLPNDCCDAGLMAYREAYHYLHEDRPKPPEPGSPAWEEAQEERMLEELEDRGGDREWWNP